MDEPKATTSDRLSALCNQLQGLLKVRHELPHLTVTPSELVDHESGMVCLTVTFKDGKKLLSVITGDADLNAEEGVNDMVTLRAEAHRCLCGYLQSMWDMLVANEELLVDFNSKIRTKRTLGGGA